MNRFRALPAGILLSLLVFLIAACDGKSDRGSTPPAKLPSAPDILSYATNPAFYFLNTAIQANSPTISGTVDAWSVSPGLPAGLTIDGKTGAITGTPTSLSAQKAYTIFANNAGGQDTYALNLTVGPLLPPSALSYPKPVATKGFAMAELKPTITNGEGATYQVLSANPLPLGLSIDPHSGILSGAPYQSSLLPIVAKIEASNPAGKTTADVSFDVELPACNYGFATSSQTKTMTPYRYESAQQQLRPMSYFLNPSEVYKVAHSPDGRLAFFTESGHARLGMLRVHEETGALGKPVYGATGTFPFDIVVHPSGQFVYVANSNGSSISVFEVDGDTLSLTKVEDEPAGHQPVAMALTPKGDLLFVANAASQSISIHGVDPKTGSLTFSWLETDVTAPIAIAVHPNGEYLYRIALGKKSMLRVYAITESGGKVILVTVGQDTVVSEGQGALSMVIPDHGLTLYVADYIADTIKTFKVRANGSIHSPITTQLPKGSDPVALELDPPQTGLHAVCNGTHEIASFSFLPSGEPATAFRLPYSRTQASPQSLALLPAMRDRQITSKQVYALDAGAQKIFAFDADAKPTGNGALNASTSGPTPSPQGPASLALHPGQRVLLATSNGLGVASFVRDLATGGLAPSTGLGGGHFQRVLIEPSGRFGYALSGIGLSSIQAFSIDGTTGVLSASGFPSAGIRRSSVAVTMHPTGRSLLTVSQTDNKVQVFGIDLEGGFVKTPAEANTGAGPIDVVAHPSGRFAYVLNSTDNTISQFLLNGPLGAITPISPASTKLDAIKHDPISMAVTGTHVFVSNGAHKEVLAFLVNPTTGELGKAATSPVGHVVDRMHIDASDRFIYLGSGDKTLSSWKIDTSSGGLINGAQAVVESKSGGFTLSTESQ